MYSLVVCYYLICHPLQRVYGVHFLNGQDVRCAEHVADMPRQLGNPLIWILF